MTEPRTLAFGDDGSSAADVCWLWINNHRWPGWRVEVVTADEPPIGPPPSHEEATLHRWTPPEPRQPFEEAEIAEVVHLTARLDPRLALCTEVDLLVIGPRRPGLLAPLPLGSTAEWLVEHPLAPMVIVRSGHTVRRVLVAHDGSVHAERAFDAFLRLPWSGDAQITVLTIDEGRMHLDEVRAKAQRQLDAAGLDAELRVSGGKPTTAILEHIDANPCDLLVLGTRGLTGWARIRAGSTAGAIARVAPCSVMLACADEQGERKT